MDVRLASEPHAVDHLLRDHDWSIVPRVCIGLGRWPTDVECRHAVGFDLLLLHQFFHALNYRASASAHARCHLCGLQHLVEELGVIENVLENETVAAHVHWFFSTRGTPPHADFFVQCAVAQTLGQGSRVACVWCDVGGRVRGQSCTHRNFGREGSDE